MKKLILEISEPDKLTVMENTLIPSIAANEVKQVYHKSLMNLGLSDAVRHLSEAIQSAMIGDRQNKERHIEKALNQVVSAPCHQNLMRIASLIRILDLNFEVDVDEGELVN